MQRPMRSMLDQASRRLSFHMPGAQGRAPFSPFDPYLLDTTEVDSTDDLYRPTGAIAKAQRLAAKCAGAADSLLLTGGSTAGLHAMLCYAARRGDEVILPRNAHISCVHICATAGITPVFADMSLTSDARPYTTYAAYLRAMDAHPRAKAVVALRPDYYGLIPPLERIAAEARARGMLVLCDEAHGATFNWRADPGNAGARGADLFVQSAHKTLPALTSGAWLHAMAGVDVSRLRRVLRMVQTSSPSFLSMLSLDDARAWMDEHGPDAIRALADALDTFRARAGALGYADGQTDAPEGYRYDRLRLVLRAPQGGFRLAEQFADVGVDVEMSDERCAVMIVSLLDGPERLDRLLSALSRVPPRPRVDAPPPAPPAALPPRAMPLSEAAFAPAEALSLREAVGRASACCVGLYPPGVALLTPGETVTKELTDFLAQIPARRAFGLTDEGGLLCVSRDEHHTIKEQTL